jgi:hypothetical protein
VGSGSICELEHGAPMLSCVVGEDVGSVLVLEFGVDVLLMASCLGEKEVDSVLLREFGLDVWPSVFCLVGRKYGSASAPQFRYGVLLRCYSWFGEERAPYQQTSLDRIRYSRCSLA